MSSFTVCVCVRVLHVAEKADRHGSVLVQSETLF